MPEYLTPGVYVQEVDTGPRPIEGVGTACAGFVGLAPNGPANSPVLVTNWSQYVNIFGSLDDSGKRNPHMPGTYMSHSVYGYFLNGGGRCYVTRVVPKNGHAGNGKLAPPTVQLPSKSSRALPSLTLRSKEAAPTEDIEVTVTAAVGDGQPEGAFTLRIKMGAAEELFENVSLGKRSPRPVTETVNQTSKLVMVIEEQAQGTLAERMPEAGSYFIRSQQTVSQPMVKVEDFAGDIVQRSGMEGMQIAEDVTMVCCPDLMAAYQAGALDRDGVKSVQLKMIAHCELMGDRVAILDPLPDLNPQEVGAWRLKETNYDSKYAALYYPWITVPGPDNRPMAMPPSGHMAGIWARNDNERGVHKAPANEVIRGVLESATPITKGEQDTLNPVGVNCIRTFSGRGVRVWGARTLSSDPAWRYINVRRLFNYIEKSIELGTQWIVFEPNTPDLRARVRRDVGAFLNRSWREGMLFGLTAGEAFFVKCDAEINPPEVRDVGQLIIDVGLAPVKPAEFVIFRLSQIAGGGA
ncbi:MAG: phage tail sheath subtilisin-like domain-containing protein [Chloroflexota bacterium]